MYNQDELAELKTFLRVAEGWTLGIVETAHGENLTDAIATKHLQFTEVIADDPNLRYLYKRSFLRPWGEWI